MRTQETGFTQDESDEPLGESLLKPTGWLAAFAVLSLVGVAQVSDVADRRAEWPQSRDIQAQQDRDQQLARRATAAQAMCTSDFGPQVLAVWVNEDTVECVGRRGQRLSTLAPEVTHAAR